MNKDIDMQSSANILPMVFINNLDNKMTTSCDRKWSKIGLFCIFFAKFEAFFLIQAKND